MGLYRFSNNVNDDFSMPVLIALAGSSVLDKESWILGSILGVELSDLIFFLRPKGVCIVAARCCF